MDSNILMMISIASGASAVLGIVGLPYRWNTCVERIPHYARPSNAVIIAMISVAIRSGLSITRALRTVARVCNQTCGYGAKHIAQYMQHVCDELERGNDWESAWGIQSGANRRDRLQRGDDIQLVTMLSDALEASWKRGVSPVIRLNTALEHIDATSKQQVEETAAALSVRVLLPVGLCFLPSFIVVGIVPAIASFATGGA